MYCRRQISYAALLQDYPFKGSEGALKALEAHDLVQVSYVDGRPSMVRPGKPVFRHAFGKLVEGELETGSQSVELPFSLKTRMDLEINLFVIPLLTTSPRSFPSYFAVRSPRSGLPSDMLYRIHYSSHLESRHGYPRLGSRAIAARRHSHQALVHIQRHSFTPQLARFTLHHALASICGRDHV